MPRGLAAMPPPPPGLAASSDRSCPHWPPTHSPTTAGCPSPDPSSAGRSGSPEPNTLITQENCDTLPGGGRLLLMVRRRRCASGPPDQVPCAGMLRDIPRFHRGTGGPRRSLRAGLSGHRRNERLVSAASSVTLKIKNTMKSMCYKVADGVGFEPTVRLHARRFSRPLP